MLDIELLRILFWCSIVGAFMFVLMGVMDK